MGRAGPGALIAGIITNHHAAWLLFPPSSPAHSPWGLQLVETTEGKQTQLLSAFPQAGGCGCSPQAGRVWRGAATPRSEGQDPGDVPQHFSFGSQKLDPTCEFTGPESAVNCCLPEKHWQKKISYHRAGGLGARKGTWDLESDHLSPKPAAPRLAA